MIVINDLDTILPHDLVEVRLRDHVTCLHKGVLFDFGVMQDCGKLLGRVKVYTDLPLILDLVKVRVRHLHLLFILRLIPREDVLVLLESLLLQYPLGTHLRVSGFGLQIHAMIQINVQVIER